MNSVSTKCLKAFALALMTFTMTYQVWAGGFSIYEQGGRATAQGGAVVARPWDASAAFYNPAGLAMYGGAPGTYRFYGGITPVQSLSKFSGLDPTPGTGVHEEAKEKWFPPFYLYGMYQINDNMAAGIAVTTPFGLGTEWKNPNNTYSGRFRSILGDIKVVYVSPTFSYKVNDMFGFGAGVDIVYSEVTLQKHNGALFFNGTETKTYDVIDIKLTGKDKTSFGFHVAAFAKLNEMISFGVDYKHSVQNDYKGTARFHQINSDYSALNASVSSTLANPAFGGLKQNGNTGIEFPNSIVVGVAVKPMSNLSAEVDFGYVGWSSFKTVEIKFPESNILTSSVLDENYKNAWQIRMGAEYDVNSKLSVRAGYIYDKAPAPTNTVNPLLPDANRNDLSIGAGYKLNDNWHVDAAYMAVLFAERSTKGTNLENYDGVYNSHVNLFSLGFGYTFGK